MKWNDFPLLWNYFQNVPETLLPVSFMCVCGAAYSQVTVNKRTLSTFVWCVPVKTIDKNVRVK
jgi:hypothetical protein